MFPRSQFTVVYLDEFKREGGVNAASNRVFAQLGLPEHPVADTSAKNTRRYEPMSGEMQERLRAFYAPYDAALEKLLGEKVPWRK